MVLCVGPTGSGKTTTLHSALGFINVPAQDLDRRTRSRSPSQAAPGAGESEDRLDLRRALRAFRADPDVIMIGEIRDTETAQMAIEASLTGHLVLSTLHTNSAPDGDACSTWAWTRSTSPTRCSPCSPSGWCAGCARIAGPAPATERRSANCSTATCRPSARRPAGDARHASRRVDRALRRDGRLLHYDSPGCDHCAR